MRGGPIATMAMLVLIVPDTAVKASPRQQTVVDICNRTAEVQTAILAAIGSGTCSTITDTQLASITTLTVRPYSASSVVPADFAGLTGLTSLSIHASSTLNTVPANAFDGLTALDFLDIDSNSLTTLDAGPHPSRASRRTRGR